MGEEWVVGQATGYDVCRWVESESAQHGVCKTMEEGRRISGAGEAMCATPAFHRLPASQLIVLTSHEYEYWYTSLATLDPAD